MGVAQVKELCKERREEMLQFFHLIAADGAYGNHRFLGPLKDEPCGIVVRLRRDRVLYAEPGPYGGRWRPRVHGERFAFKEPATWCKSETMVELEDERWRAGGSIVASAPFPNAHLPALPLSPTCTKLLVP